MSEEGSRLSTAAASSAARSARPGSRRRWRGFGDRPRPRRADAGAPRRRPRSRSTARTRPGSPPRPRTGSRSRPSTSRPSMSGGPDMLGTWAAAAAQLTKGLPIGAVETSPEAPPIDTGEAMGLRSARLTVTVGFGPSLFDKAAGSGLDAPGCPQGPAGTARRRPGPGAHRRRPVRAGLRRRPAGRLPRDPQLRPDGARDGRDALVAARLRADVVDLDVAGDAAQPDGLQGRHQQHQGRGRPPVPTSTGSSGSATRPTRPG